MDGHRTRGPPLPPVCSPHGEPDRPEGGRDAPHTFRGLPLFPFQRRSVAGDHGREERRRRGPDRRGQDARRRLRDRVGLRGRATRGLHEPDQGALEPEVPRLPGALRRGQGRDHDRATSRSNPRRPLLVMTTEIFRNTIFEDPGAARRLRLRDLRRGPLPRRPRARHGVGGVDHLRAAAHPHRGALGHGAERRRARRVDRRGPRGHGRGDRRGDAARPPHAQDLDPRSRPALALARCGSTSSRRAGGRDARERRGRARGGRHGGRRSRRAQEEQHLGGVGEAARLPRAARAPAGRSTSRSAGADCERLARANARRELLDPERAPAHARALRRARRALRGDGRARARRHLRPLAAHGVLYHHAGMLPIDKEIVERLFTTGLVKMLFATETFSLGVNMPARTVAFHALCKFDGDQLRSASSPATTGRWPGGRGARASTTGAGSSRCSTRRGSITTTSSASSPAGPSRCVSRFNLSYSGILNLYRRVGDRVTDAWERSFARYQRDREAAREDGVRRRAAQIRARLDVLESLRLHPGRHAHAEGRAVRARERVRDRRDRGAARTAGSAAATRSSWPCSSRRWSTSRAATTTRRRPRAPSRASPCRSPCTWSPSPSTELRAPRGVPDAACPDFGVAGPVQLWAEGMDFDRVLARTSLAPGDLVRLLRMTIQMLRQVEHALAAEDPTREALRAARELIDRDVVDARRQLELG